MAKVAAKMNRVLNGLALAALLLCAGCSSFRFEPTANWWRDGGRICAANRETNYDFDRAAPRSCVQAFNGAPASPERRTDLTDRQPASQQTAATRTDKPIARPIIELASNASEERQRPAATDRKPPAAALADHTEKDGPIAEANADGKRDVQLGLGWT